MNVRDCPTLQLNTKVKEQHLLLLFINQISNMCIENI
jgi:hypothetical protein